MMSIVLVSSNPLFAEVLSHTLQEAGASLIQVTPEEAAGCIAAEQPAIVLVDESRMEAPVLGELLAVGRRQPETVTILVNLQDNDITIVSARRATIGKGEDMQAVIRSVEAERGKGTESGAAQEATSPAGAARARAGAYGFLALLCNQRPEVSLVRRLRAVGVAGFLGLVEGEAAGEAVRQGLQQMGALVEQTSGQSEEEVATALAVDWTRLFRGVQPGYGPPPPYEGLWRGGDPLGALQAVARVYREQGVGPAGGSAGNRLDYLGLELDYLRYVCEQQALAYEQGEEAAFERWSEAEAAFVEDHVGQWAARYCDSAAAEARTAFYGGALLLMKGLLEELAGEPADHSLDAAHQSRRTR